MLPEVVFDRGWTLSHQGIWAAQDSFAVTADGRSLMLYNRPEAVPTGVDVVFNWLERLQGRVPIP